LEFRNFILDISNFKSANDGLGRRGDLVLQMVRRTECSLGIPTRLGGGVGKFVVIVANSDTAILAVGERFRTLVERSSLIQPKPISVTLSMGGAQALPDDTVESLLRRADKNLYLAKRSGKNCICI
jgi:diguanylate cyclase (GGDEF)-like protein